MEVMDALRFVADASGVSASEMDCALVLNKKVLKVLSEIDGEGHDADAGGADAGDDDGDDGHADRDAADGVPLNDVATTWLAQTYYLNGIEPARRLNGIES